MSAKKIAPSSQSSNDDNQTGFYPDDNSSIDYIQHLEQLAVKNDDDVKKEDVVEVQRSIKRNKQEKLKNKKIVKLKGGGPLAFASVTVALLGAIAAIILSPSLMLVNMKENLVNDLNDTTGAYYTFAKKVLEGQIGGGDCNEESIDCKFKTMSPMLKKRFEDQDIKVIGIENKTTKRYNVKSVLLPNNHGVAVSGTQLNLMAGSIDDVQYRLDNAITPKNGIFHDRKFEDRLYEKFHLPHRLTVTGLTAKDINKSFNESLVKKADYFDKDGRGVFGLHYLADTSPLKQLRIYDGVISKTNTHLGHACSLYTYGNLLDDAARRAQSTTVARFAMQYMAAADTIKSGNNASYEMVISALADKLSVPDDHGKNGLDGSSFRVPALQQRVSTYMPNLRTYMNDAMAIVGPLILGIAPALVGTEYMRNTPRLIPSDGSGGSMYDICSRSMTKAQENKEKQDQCWSGAMLPTVTYSGPVSLAVVLKFEEIFKTVVCSLGIPFTVFVMKLLTSVETLIYTTATLPIAARLSANRFNANTTGVAAQDAIFAGTGVILGDTAQSFGMRPASVVSFKEYLTITTPIRIAMARSDQIAAAKNQLDITNQHSFLGTIVRTMFGSRTQNFSSLASAISSVVGIIPRASMATALPVANALYSQPLNFDFTRFVSGSVACGPATDIMINPDFGCNIRYSMEAKDLSKRIPDVISYMTQPHPENAQKGLAEIEGRDLSADPSRGTDLNNLFDTASDLITNIINGHTHDTEGASNALPDLIGTVMGLSHHEGAKKTGESEGDRMKREAAEGAKQPYIDKRTGKPNIHTEYGKFIRYCTNRDYTWGTIGMAVEPKERTYPPDEEDLFSKEHYLSYSGSSIEYGDNEPEGSSDKRASSLGIVWGSSVDQEWLSGKKCLESSDMLSNFRAYTAACRVLAGVSGSRECWLPDAMPTFNSGFYPRNDIIFVKEN